MMVWWKKAELKGFNPGVCDGAIQVAEHVQQVGEPDKEVCLLLEMNGAFSASSLQNICS